MDVDIRSIRPDEHEAWHRVLASSFSEHPRDDEIAFDRKLTEFDRTFAALDGTHFVGAAATVSFRLTVPGAETEMAGVTAVGVAPTHRRRGIARALMRHQLDHIREVGREPVAALYASEGSIYERYGYGSAIADAGISVERERTRFAGPPPGDGGQVRLIAREQAIEAFDPVYEEVRRTQPGMIDRPGDWWEERLWDHEDDRDGFTALFFAVRETAGGIDGYATYRFKHDWHGGIPNGILRVEELVGANPEANAALWRYVFDVDLAGRIEANHRPLDDPLLSLLAEPRRLRFTVRDGMWIRIVDVAAALEARRYATSDRLVLDVRDDFCPWNEGRFELEGGPEGAQCRRTDAEPDLRLSSTELGAAYVGGTSIGQLSRAGRVDEESAHAVRRATAMFSWDPGPWCPQHF